MNGVAKGVGKEWRNWWGEEGDGCMGWRGGWGTVGGEVWDAGMGYTWRGKEIGKSEGG